MEALLNEYRREIEGVELYLGEAGFTDASLGAIGFEKSGSGIGAWFGKLFNAFASLKSPKMMKFDPSNASSVDAFANHVSALFGEIQKKSSRVKDQNIINVVNAASKVNEHCLEFFNAYSAVIQYFNNQVNYRQLQEILNYKFSIGHTSHTARGLEDILEENEGGGSGAESIESLSKKIGVLSSAVISLSRDVSLRKNFRRPDEEEDDSDNPRKKITRQGNAYVYIKMAANMFYRNLVGTAAPLKKYRITNEYYEVLLYGVNIINMFVNDRSNFKFSTRDASKQRVDAAKKMAEDTERAGGSKPEENVNMLQHNAVVKINQMMKKHQKIVSTAGSYLTFNMWLVNMLYNNGDVLFLKKLINVLRDTGKVEESQQPQQPQQSQQPQQPRQPQQQIQMKDVFNYLVRQNDIAKLLKSNKSRSLTDAKVSVANIFVSDMLAKFPQNNIKIMNYIRTLIKGQGNK